MQKTFKYSAEYASQCMTEIPPGYIDKTICGCGLTSVALENNINTVIAVPSISLVTNKVVQYPNKRTDNKVLGVWGETDKKEIEEYCKENEIWKIMVTYDSLPKVSHLLDYCHLVIDESNELLSKTKLKPEAIDKVFELAHKYKDTVSFISATPIPLKYMPAWLSDIDYITLEWDNTIKVKPIICERRYTYKAFKNEFLIPLNLNGSLTIETITFSKAIIFINSINSIVEVLKDSGVSKEDCGIICGSSLKNDIKIKNIKRVEDPNNLPKFTFITSSGFAGIDLNDKDAMTFVVSNTNQEHTMLDMLTDIKQAVSRQRDKSNPTYGTFVYIYNQTMFNKTEEELLEILQITRERIESTMRLWELAKREKEEKGFVPDELLLTYTFFRNNSYQLNEQAFNADKYFILELKKQYTKGFDLKSVYEVNTVLETIELKNKDSISLFKDMVHHFNSSHINGRCDWNLYAGNESKINIIQECYKLYKKVYNTEWYCKKMISNYLNPYDRIKFSIFNKFKIGESYSFKDVKSMLQKIYKEENLDKTAKGTDLQEFFILKKVSISSVEKGYKVLSKIEN